MTSSSSFEDTLVQLRTNSPQLTILNCVPQHRDVPLRRLADALLDNTHLLVLFLNGNDVTATGMQRLAPSLPCSLQYLYLGNNALGSQGTMALATTLPWACPTLKVLQLSHNEIGDSAARALAEILVRCKSLERLVLDGNPLTDHAGRILAHALGDGASNRLRQVLDVRNTSMSKDIVLDFTRAMQRNPTLLDVLMDFDTEYNNNHSEFKYYRELNQSGRSEWGSDAIGALAWTRVLASSSTPAVLMTKLRARPDLLQCSSTSTTDAATSQGKVVA